MTDRIYTAAEREFLDNIGPARRHGVGVDRYIAALDEIDRLREALQPFSDAAQYCHHDFDDDYSPDWAMFFTCGDFRRARSALSREDE